MTYIEELKIDKDLLLEFILKLSRFEFALKLVGYARGDENLAEPDWERFSKDIDDRFDKDNTPELARVCKYFLFSPPKQQTLEDDALQWSRCLPRQSKTETELLLGLARRVRSNLCHGGESGGKFHKETANSEALLRGSLMILDECLRAAPEVKQAFDGTDT